MVHPADLDRARVPLHVAFAVLCLANRCAQSATGWDCRNATYVRTRDRLMLIEQSDASADALRVRSIPCAPSSAPLGDCTFESSLPGALLAPTSPWCADRLPLINVDLRNMTRPLPLLTGAGSSSNIRLWLTPDARLRFERRSDGSLLAEELVPHRFSPVSLLGQAAGAIHEALNFTFAAKTGERLYGLGQHQLAQCSDEGATQRGVCTRGVLDLKGADHTVCDKSGTECTGDHTDNCTKKQPCRLSKHQRDGLSNLHGENMEITVPLVHSNRGYSYLMNVPAMGEVQLNANGSSWVFYAALQLDLWFVSAPAGAVGSAVWNQRMSGYVNATGHSPLWPEWASGFWQSKNRYRNQSEILDVANRYIALGLPLTVIAIDYYSWGQDAPGDDDFGDRVCWPDPGAMVDELHALGVEPLLSAYFNYVRPGPVNMSGRPGIINPIVPASVNWLPAVAADALASNASVSSGPRHPAINGFDNPKTAVYDVFASDSRKLMMDAAVRHYTHQYGIKSWWLDCDEPCGEFTSQERVWYNHGKWPAEAVGAAYPGYLDQAVWEAMQREGKQDDFVMLGRAAWAGSHRWGGGLWSGDIHSHWAVLSQQFTAGLNAAMSGVVYWATDIGGYASHDTADPDWRELVVRWFQWSALCPIYRLHGHTSGPCEPGSGPNSTVLADTCSGGKFSQPPISGVVCDRSNEIWSFGKATYDAIVQTMQLRQRLRPYIREQWRQASRSGTPPIRPLFWEFPDDERASLITDQMMSGPRYLVAPQFARLNESGTSRDVYLPMLPAGEVWIDEWTNATHVGGQLVSVLTPLDRFGLFRRSES